MPDRRQGDRREGGSKKLTVSLSTFVFIVLIVVIIFVSIIACIVVSKNSYKNGYSHALYEMEQIESGYYEPNYSTTDSENATEGSSSVELSN